MSIGDDIAQTLPELQAEAESLMRERILVRRVSATTTDDDGRTVTVMAPVWEGPAALADAPLQTSYPEVGGASVPVQRLVLKVPVRASLRDGDEVEFTAQSETPGLAGVRVRVEGYTPMRTNATQHRIPVSRIDIQADSDG